MIYICDNCHYTFASDKQEYVCPECKVSSIERKLGKYTTSVPALREATKWETDMYLAQANTIVPAVIGDPLLKILCNLEKTGVVFAKIGKSSDCTRGKGEHYPYKIGLTPYNPRNSFTFEPINIVHNYMHYGDELIIFSFTEMLKKHKNEVDDILAICEDSKNRGCFQANMLYVSEIIPLNSKRAIDKMVPYVSETEIESILSNYYNNDEGDFDTICYLEQKLRERFPTFTKQHTMSGDIEKTKIRIFRLKKLIRETIKINYVTYRRLRDIFHGNTMPINSKPIVVNGIEYSNVELW